MLNLAIFKFDGAKSMKLHFVQTNLNLQINKANIFVVIKLQFLSQNTKNYTFQNYVNYSQK